MVKSFKALIKIQNYNLDPVIIVMFSSASLVSF